jgi:predicted nucleic acid-binding protein
VLLALAGIDHISVEDRGAVPAAIENFKQGLDFADAMHLARASHAAAFVTFDRGLARRASGLAATPPIELLK